MKEKIFLLGASGRLGSHWLPELKKLGYEYIETAANFITIVLKTPLEAEIMCSELLKKGVIVRHLKGFGWPECVRVSIGTTDENQFFINNLKII